MSSGDESKIDLRHLSRVERIEKLKKVAHLDELDALELTSDFSLGHELGQKLIENYISNIEVPLGIATNFVINGKEYLIPMATEEPSVVAACSNGARIAKMKGGFLASASDSIMIGQVQIVNLKNVNDAKKEITRNKEKIIGMANERSNTLRSLGKGARDIEFNEFVKDSGMLVLHLLVDVGDAMGANVINSMCEYIAKPLEEITGGEVVLRILSNLAPHRIVKASAIFSKEQMGGSDGVRRFMYSARLAEIDPYRATTHNKGIMNGIDAVLLATMNDWRQAEANAHAYASMGGQYTSLSRYELTDEGDVKGTIEIPISAGTVGGTSRSVPRSRIALKILGVSNAKEFEEIIACVGLAQNYAAMRALSNEGIQKGHMTLHSKNLAIAAGAKDDEIEKVSNMLVKSGIITAAQAVKFLQEIRRIE